MSAMNDSKHRDTTPTKICIMHGHYGTVRQSELADGGAGFRFFGINTPLQQSVLQELSPWMIPPPGTLTSAADTILVARRVSNDLFLLVKSIACSHETDDFDRPRGFLSTFCLLHVNDFIEHYRAQAFTLFRQRSLWPESYHEALTAGAQTPAAEQFQPATPPPSEDIDLRPLNPRLHSVESLRLLEQTLISVAGEHTSATFPWHTSPAGPSLPKLVETLLHITPLDARPDLSFDTGACGTSGRRRDTSLRSVIEGTREQNSTAAHAQNSTPPRCAAVYGHWSTQQAPDLTEFISDEYSLLRSNVYRLCRHINGLAEPATLLGSRNQQDRAWKTLLHAAKYEIANSISHSLIQRFVPEREAELLATKYAAMMQQLDPDPALLLPDKLRLPLLCRILRLSSQPSDPEWYRWDLNTVSVCVSPRADWNLNPQQRFPDLHPDRRYMLGILLILKQHWTDLRALLRQLDHADVTELLSWSLNYFNPKVSYLKPFIERCLVWLGILVTAPGFQPEHFTSLVQVVSQAGYAELLSKLLTAREYKQSAKHSAAATARRISKKPEAPAASWKAPTSLKTSAPPRPAVNWMLVLRPGEFSVRAISPGQHAQFPATIQQRLSRELKRVERSQIVIPDGDDVWAIEIVPGGTAISVLAVRTDARTLHDRQQHPLELLYSTFPGLATEPCLPARDSQTARIGRRVILAMIFAVAAGRSVELHGALTSLVTACFGFWQHAPLELCERVSLQLAPDRLLLETHPDSAVGHKATTCHIHCESPPSFHETTALLFPRLVLSSINPDLTAPLQPDESQGLKQLYVMSDMLQSNTARYVSNSAISLPPVLVSLVRKTAQPELQQALLSRLQASLGTELAQLLAPAILPHLTDDTQTLQVLTHGFNLLWLAELATEPLQQLSTRQVTTSLRKHLLRLLTAQELENTDGLPCRLVIAMLLDDETSLNHLLQHVADSPTQQLLQLLEQQVRFHYRLEVLPTAALQNADLAAQISSRYNAPCSAFWNAAHGAAGGILMTPLLQTLLHCDNSTVTAT
ncbi:MAG: hypothetical protein ACKO3T_14150 [Planctomycetaceae bacterium]